MMRSDGGIGRRADGSAKQLSFKARNITDLLDTLLLGYDQHLRPDLGGECNHLHPLNSPAGSNEGAKRHAVLQQNGLKQFHELFFSFFTQLKKKLTRQTLFVCCTLSSLLYLLLRESKF